jgi:hypothetical protein
MLGLAGGSEEPCQRLDLNGDNFITIVGDVLLYNGMIGENYT